MLGSLTALALLLAGPAPAAPPPPPPPEASMIAPGVWFVPGRTTPDRQPNGNSVLFQAPQGWVVVDTGRHDGHAAAIDGLARSKGGRIAAVINTHWHLDHVSGNLDLKAAHPGLKVYASAAIDEALTGFLARGAEDAKAYLESGSLPPATAEDVRGDLATFERGAELRPDVVIASSGPRVLAGRRFDVRLSPHAATAGDVWLYDPRTRLAVVGDLVTFPSPYLDTACPDGWRRALDEVWAVPFTRLVPGHGAPMSRAEFAAYRTAFGALIDCAGSKADGKQCANAWADYVAARPGTPASAVTEARGAARYYVQEVLRANGGRSASCKAA